MDASLTKLRAWWFRRQGLDGSIKTISETLTSCGWARSVGGSAPYLGFFARTRAGRQAVDNALANAEIHELPSARNCTHVVAAADYALALKAGEPFSGGEIKVAQKLGVTPAEIDKLAAAVLDALAKTPLDPDGLKAALGSKVRNLGEDGKKKGITTTLPVALGLLQAQGEIRRIPVNGRLDQQRYQYAVWRPNPLAKYRLTQEQTFVELARRYFHWIGPATLAGFQWFSGLGVKAAKAAIEPLKLLEIDGHLLPPDLADAFAAFKAPKAPQYALVGSIDSSLLLRRDLKSMMDEQDLLASAMELPSHAILANGRIAGLWEFDPETGTIAWATFGKSDSALKKAVQEMEDFIRTDLGDARSFSLDSPKSRAPRIAALRASGR